VLGPPRHPCFDDLVPFTLSHSAAVLPLARTPLPLAGLVIGSMAPDFPYFVTGVSSRTVTHDWWALPTIDLLMGLVAFALWRGVLRAPFLDSMPEKLARRMRGWGERQGRRRATGFRALGWLVLALLVGELTHVLWDSFTHEDGWMVVRLAPLRQELGPTPLWHWLQYASGLVGGAALIWWVVASLRAAPSSPARTHRLRPGASLAAWLCIAMLGAGVGVAIWLPRVLAGASPVSDALLFRAITIAIGAATAAACLLALLWHLARRRSD